MFTDHSALKYLVNKPVSGGKICRWLFLFQEYDFEIIVKLGRLNERPDHLSRLEKDEEPNSFKENMLDAQLFSIQIVDDYYKGLIKFLTTSTTLAEYSVM